MQIALLSEGIYPLKIGGIQKHSWLFSKYLAKSSIFVDLYFYGEEGQVLDPLIDLYSPDELDFINFYMVSAPRLPYFPGHFLYFSWLVSSRICNAMQKNDKSYDLIYIQGFSGWALLDRHNRVKNYSLTFLNFHGLEMFQRAATWRNKLEHLLFRPFVDHCLKKANYVVSLGGQLSKILLTRTGNQQKVLEIPIGIDGAWLISDKCSKVQMPNLVRHFVFVGRYERRKGIQELNKVLGLLVDNFKFQFDFIGPIPSSHQFQHPSISYHGLVKDSQKIKRILRKADILVCPSWSEGMPTVILEAMASGCAIIATNVGAVSCLVSKDNGWLIDTGEIKALELAIKEGIELDQGHLNQKKEHSIKLVKEQYSWKAVIDLFLQRVKPLIQ